MPELIIAPDTVPPGRIVTARSYLIDRFVPDVEIIVRAKTQKAGGTLAWRIGDLAATPPLRPGRLKSVLPFRPGRQTAPEGRWILDLRDKSPENWAHFLNNHIPLVFGAAEAAGLDATEAVVILPKAIPGYILDAAAFFGLTALATDDVVTGYGLEVEVTPWTAIRAIRHRWVHLPGPRGAIEALGGAKTAVALPRKAFLSRKDTRVLSNSAEIEPILAARGFETIYPETLSVADQFRLFRRAEEMVAIHGAGLAPLLYCDPGHVPRRLVEILPCGHMTDVYRAMAAQVGCRWVGVRGRIKPEYVRPAYTLEEPFKAYSLDAFEIDPASLEEAFRHLDEDMQEVVG